MEPTPDPIDFAGPEMAEGRAGTNPIAVVWRHLWLVLFVTAVSTGFGYLYYLRCPPLYRSRAEVVVVVRSPWLMSDEPGQDRSGNQNVYTNTLQTQFAMMRSPVVVERALKNKKKLDLSTLPSLRGSSNPVGAIVGGLQTEDDERLAKSNTSILPVMYRGGDSEDCPKVLAAVLDAYQEFLGETYQDLSKETVKLISQAKDVLMNQLAEKEKAYRKFRQEAPLLWKGAEAANLHESRMVAVESARAQLLVDSNETSTLLRAIEDAVKRGGSREALGLLIQRQAKEAAGKAIPPADRFENSLFSAALDEQMLLQEYGPEHPKVKGAHKKLSFIRGYLGADAQGEGKDQPLNVIEAYLESLRESVQVHAERLRGLDSLFEKERTAAKSLQVHQITDETYQTEIRRNQQLFDVVVKRLDEISLLRDANNVVTHVISPPGPGAQIEPRLAQILGIAALCGFMLGFGAGYLFEALDKRFRTPEEVAALLRLPIMGHIPLIESRRRPARGEEGDEKAGLATVLCVAHRPRGRQAEAYRAVRTALYFSTRTDGEKVIQVTSPNPGDGKTTTAANLALSIAQSGKRVVLVDADFRRPRIHEYFNVDNSVGLSTLITGDAEVPDAVKPSAVENLWLLPTGERPSNPSELLTSARFKELIDVLREQYDFVILDSPPVLVVSDPSAIAPRADAVLMVLRLTKNARSTVRHATETLTGLGAKILGVVVNAVGQSSWYGYGGYGYGGYRYGYGKNYGYRYRPGYGYGHGYGYGYGDGYGTGYGAGYGDEGYYADERKPRKSNGSLPQPAKTAAESRGETTET